MSMFPDAASQPANILECSHGGSRFCVHIPSATANCPSPPLLTETEHRAAACWNLSETAAPCLLEVFHTEHPKIRIHLYFRVLTNVFCSCLEPSVISQPQAGVRAASHGMKVPFPKED